MAVESNCVVHIHENPLDKHDVWQRRIPSPSNSVRLRKKVELSKRLDDHVCNKEIAELEPEDKIAHGVNTRDLKSSDYHFSGYAVLAAASKGSQKSGRRTVIGESAGRLNLASPSYQTFHRRHTSGSNSCPKSYHVQESKQNEPEHIQRTRAKKDSCEFENDPTLFPGIFCCGKSAHSVVENTTCMCCVKGVLYHCTKDSTDGEIGPTFEQPCTCGTLSRGCVKNWTLLAVCSIFLPCLCCYLPAKGCSDVYRSYREHKKSCQKRRTRGLDR